MNKGQDLFYISLYSTEEINKARKLEKESKWREAAKIWASIGYEVDRDACIYIAEAIERADRFRDALSRKCGECPDVPNPSDSIAFRKYMDCLQQISMEEV